MTGRGGSTGPGPRDKNPQGSRAPVPPNPQHAANNPTPPPEAKGPLRRVVRVVNPSGLHMRVADRFARTAGQYTCTVTVWHGESRADGTNIWDLIALLVLPDSDVVLEVDGPDAPKALDPLAAILASPGGEDYTI